MKYSILIVEDEFKISDVIKSYLEKENFNVYQAFNGEEALYKFKEFVPDLIILDLMLPDFSGEEVCKKIRKSSNVPIIMLTAKTQENSILNGFNIGIDDYMTKPFSTMQLVARIKAVLKRTYQNVNHNIIFGDNDLEIDFEKHEVKKKGVNIKLTPAEYKLLVTFVNFKDKVYTRDELIDLVLSDDFEGYERVIDTHIKNLRQKIEDDSRNPKYIITVFGIGYKFGGNNEI